MRTGAEYKDSLRDGRDVWVMGEGAVADVTTDRATSAMVNEYVRWYDRHLETAMGLEGNPQTIEQSVELTVNVNTTRTCMIAAELDKGGRACLAQPSSCRAAGIDTLEVRQQVGEFCRDSSVHRRSMPPDGTEFSAPVMAAEREDTFGRSG